MGVGEDSQSGGVGKDSQSLGKTLRFWGLEKGLDNYGQYEVLITL